MRVLFVVNNPRGLRATHTTAYLAAAAVRRGHDVALVSVDDLACEREVMGRVVRPPPGAGREVCSLVACLRSPQARYEEMRLSDFDVVLLRNNPHVSDGRSIRVNPAIELGRRLRAAGVLVLSDPDGLGRAASKMYLASFPASVRPRTLVTCSPSRVRAFVREIDGPAVIKPLFGFGGQNVFFVERGQTGNLAQIIATVRASGYLIVQECIAAAVRGDKRVLACAGVPLASGGRAAVYRRIHAGDDLRNNIHAGAKRRRCRLTRAERELCETVRPRLIADGLYLVGLDIAGGKILEMNVFAPGGMHNMFELYGIDFADAAIADLERRWRLRSAYHEPVPPQMFLRG
jgi:glutathione synthase